MNRISRLEGLSGLVNLEKLIIFGNEIEQVEGLDFLAKLKELNISRNRISNSIHRLAIVPSLTATLVSLNASHNQIPVTELENIAFMVSSLKALKSLDLYGNAIVTSQTYKYRVSAAH